MLSHTNPVALFPEIAKTGMVSSENQIGAEDAAA